MISVLAMCDRVKARLAKQRKTIARLKLGLVMARRVNGRLRVKARVAVAQERESARQLREFRKKQMRLPL